MTKRITMAIAYDFDGTLSPMNMQEASFFAEIGIDQPSAFWSKTKAFALNNDMDEILAYMYMMLHEAQYKGISIKRESFIKHGQDIPLFPGVEYWFDRINDYAAERGVEIKHYVISSGLREMIEGTKIFGKFSHVYASGYAYNQDNIAVWPATAVNYTNKTQHLFRINKGIENSWDNESVNQYIEEDQRPIQSRNMIYIGDGETDVPAMKMTKHLNGRAIAVYDPNKPNAKEASDLRVTQDRADFSTMTDYREGKDLDRIVKGLIDRIANGDQAALQ